MPDNQLGFEFENKVANGFVPAINFYLNNKYGKNQKIKRTGNNYKNSIADLEYNGKQIEIKTVTSGNGIFLNSLKGKQFEAYDILPEDDRIVKKDIFDFQSTNHNYIAIGNPPFGKRSKLAIDIFNTVSNYSDVIAFILPVSFMKYGVQKLLNPNFKLIDYFFLPPYSFTDRGKKYDVNCVFQIWSKYGEKDLRIKKAPPISYPDFNLWQYNATPEAFNCVNEKWDIVLYRQGYKNYNKIFIKKTKKKL